jgi:hypothetical protein
MGEKFKMSRAVRIFLSIALLTLFFCCTAAMAAEEVGVPVLLYHRFGPTVADSMTTKTSVFEAQMKWLKDNGWARARPRRPSRWCSAPTTVTSPSTPTCCP